MIKALTPKGCLPPLFDRRGFPGFYRRDYDRFIQYYQRTLARKASRAIRVGWASRESQRSRFEVFNRVADLNGSSILDVGCGLGDFVSYLKKHKVRVRYTGVDLFASLVKEARRINPSCRFEVRNLLTRPFPPLCFDYAFLSGVFNVRIRNNWKYLTTLVGACLGMVRKGLAFNVLHQGARLHEEDRFAADPAETLKRCRRLPGVCGLRLFDQYHPNDFTVFLDKEALK